MQMTRSKQRLHFLDILKDKLNLHSESQEICSCCMRFYSMWRSKMFLSEWREDGYFGHLLRNESVETLGGQINFFYAFDVRYVAFIAQIHFSTLFRTYNYQCILTLPIIDIVRPSMKDIGRRWLRGRNRKQLKLLFPPTQDDRHSSTFEGLKLYQMFVLTNSCTCSFGSHIQIGLSTKCLIILRYSTMWFA